MSRRPLSNPDPALRTAEAYYFRSTRSGLGFNPIHVRLTLATSHLRLEPTRQFSFAQRGVAIAGGGLAPVEFPLSRLQRVEIHEKRVWGKDTVLRLEFDNGGREYVMVEPAWEWQAAILAARLAAPGRPYSTLPALVNGVEASPVRSLGRIMLLSAFAFAALICLCVAAALLVQDLS